MPVDPRAEDSETESPSQWSDVLAPLDDPGVELAVLDLVDAELPLHGATSERTVVGASVSPIRRCQSYGTELPALLEAR